VLEGSLDGVKFEELARGREARPGRPCLYTFPARTLRFLRMQAWTKHTDATVGIIEFQPGPGEWPAVWPENRPTRLAQNLDERVLSRKPGAGAIEFSINDSDAESAGEIILPAMLDGLGLFVTEGTERAAAARHRGLGRPIRLKECPHARGRVMS
jgi:hypothetical protein